MGMENSNNWPTRAWGFFIQKRSSGNKIWQICPFSALWNNAGASCFCDFLNQECLVIRGGQCGGFHHFWPELISLICHPQESPLYALFHSNFPSFLAQNLCLLEGAGYVWVMMVNSLLIPQWSVHTGSDYEGSLLLCVTLLWLSLGEWLPHSSLQWRSGALDQDFRITRDTVTSQGYNKSWGICGGYSYDLLIPTFTKYMYLYLW